MDPYPFCEFCETRDNGWLWMAPLWGEAELLHSSLSASRSAELPDVGRTGRQAAPRHFVDGSTALHRNSGVCHIKAEFLYIKEFTQNL